MERVCWCGPYLTEITGSLRVCETERHKERLCVLTFSPLVCLSFEGQCGNGMLISCGETLLCMCVCVCEREDFFERIIEIERNTILL